MKVTMLEFEDRVRKLELGDESNNYLEFEDQYETFRIWGRK